ncbi:MAG: PAS domain-containing hybrid sensor histidine kinase/response regulator [Proteobacteria bacterium]|nr:MAG: PAS domain-containing hybrid sensor histidine kinase/response regulator [Pseudomonadota bacterium]
MLSRDSSTVSGDNSIQRPELDAYKSEALRLAEELNAKEIELSLRSEALERSEMRLEGLTKRFLDFYNFSPVAYLTFSTAGEVVEINLKASSCLGTSRGEIFGKSFSFFVVPRSAKAFQQHIRDCINTFQPMRINLDLVDRDGRVFEAELESVASRDERDGDVLVRSILRDVTEARSAERELRLAKDSAEAASVAKTQFLANMSHEMRTPLGVILGYADLLADLDDAATDSLSALCEGVDAIQRNGKHLLNLIDELLDIAKVEAGQMKMVLSEISIREELDIIIDHFKVKCRDKGVGIAITVSPLLPPLLVTDEVRFRQIILNILSNALKFTEKGSVKIDVYMQRNPGDRDEFVCIDVEDTGCGITEEQAGQLFQPFTQADSSTSRRYGGTGLGLSLARHLAEALGGSLKLLRSEAGVGSTFTIKFLNRQAPQLVSGNEQSLGSERTVRAESHSGIEDMLVGLKVLIVEDAPDNRIILSKFLENAGALVECAEDGRRGVECASKNDYDVVLMDLRLPIMDGYRASAVLRQRGYERPIIAISAEITETGDPIENNKDFDAYLSKPINWPKLASTIIQCQSSRRHLH